MLLSAKLGSWVSTLIGKSVFPEIVESSFGVARVSELLFIGRHSE